MEQGEMEFYGAISAALEAHPDWLRTALSAVTAGMSGAVAKANERASRYDLAFRSALALSDTGRLTAETKAMLGRSIVSAIEPANVCQSEADALERYRS